MKFSEFNGDLSGDLVTGLFQAAVVSAGVSITLNHRRRHTP